MSDWAPEAPKDMGTPVWAARPPKGERMDWRVTLALLAGFAALGVFCGWRDSRPADLVKGPRMFPYRMVMLLSVVGVVLMLVHLVNLGGVETGR